MQQPVAQQVLLLMKGHPATGKSALAHCLARQLHWPLVDKDDARNCFQLPELLQQSDNLDLNSLSYNVMVAVTATQLSVGLSCVVDCPLSRVQLFHRLSELAQQVSLPALTCP